MKNIFTILLAGLLVTAAQAGDIIIFNAGTSSRAMAQVYTQAVEAAEIMMAESGSVWFAQWISEEGVTATVDAGLTNLIFTAADTAKDSAVLLAQEAITSSNGVFLVEHLAQVRQLIGTSNGAFRVELLNAAEQERDAALALNSAADLQAAQQAITASNVVFSAETLAQAESVMDAKDLTASAGTLQAAQQAITASNLVYETVYATKTELADKSDADRGFATGAVNAHTGTLASASAAGHVRLGTGLLTADGKVYTLTGARLTAPAAAEIAWDCSLYNSLDIVTELPATPTHVTLSGLVPGYTYTMTAKTGASAGKISFEVSGGVLRAVSGSMNDLTLPAGKMLLVTVKGVGGGNFIYSTAPVN